jgi:DNA invertase Pin-like site-specific DNA recombinase
MKDMSEFLEETFGQNPWAATAWAVASRSRGDVRDLQLEAAAARQRYRDDPDAARQRNRERQARWRAKNPGTGLTPAGKARMSRLGATLSEATKAKISEAARAPLAAQRAEFLGLLAAGATQTAAAKAVGVSRSTSLRWAKAAQKPTR